MSATIRIVFNALNLGGDAILVALEVDQTIVLLLTAALVARGDAAVIVATARARLLFEQRTVEIGRASCRERVCQYVSISVVAVSLKKKKRDDTCIASVQK